MSSSGRSSSSARNLIEKLKSYRRNILLLDGGTGEEMYVCDHKSECGYKCTITTTSKWLFLIPLSSS
jgi:hypothetical protein